MTSTKNLQGYAWLASLLRCTTCGGMLAKANFSVVFTCVGRNLKQDITSHGVFVPNDYYNENVTLFSVGPTGVDIVLDPRYYMNLGLAPKTES